MASLQQIVVMCYEELPGNENKFHPKGLINVPIRDTTEQLSFVFTRIQIKLKKQIFYARYLGSIVRLSDLRSVGDLLLDNIEHDALISIWVGKWSNSFQLFFKTLIPGKTLTMECYSNTTVESIRKFLLQKEGIPVESRLIFRGGQQLEDGRRLIDYKIKREDTIHIVLRLCGGGLCGIDFADVSNDQSLQQLEYSQSAPNWRHARDGINVEGYCQNNDCEAFKKCVIDPQGFGQIDIISHHFKCPMCSQQIKPVTCGLANCEWTYIGKKARESQLVKGKYERSSREKYERFNEVGNMVQWIHLVFVARESPNKRVKEQCSICLEFVEDSETCYTATCGHHFHNECFDEYKKNFKGIYYKCPNCRQQF
eukprot:TRINITY_DN305_c1_g1_i4.p1 TRINITY_DN305_c1_g1~~TRINITY_DN305_c1_g1_i4.p1  ORF type:complete len:368 (-),score=20.50 TRINITY_DN305_c1_g1_i4:363-1466(-)